MKDCSRGIKQYPFYGLLKCPYCGMNMVRFKRARTAYWTCGGQGESCVRRERTNCVPYAVRDEVISAALNKASYPLEYAPLKALVSVLTFPKWDWSHLKVISAQSKEKHLLLPVDYGKPADTPFPIFSKQKCESTIAGKKQTAIVLTVNGIRIRPGFGNRTRSLVESLQKHVSDLIILPPEDYEPAVPRVDPRGK